MSKLHAGYATDTASARESLASYVPPGGPLSIPGLALWLDSANVDGASNGSLVDGQAIAQWNDLSGNGRHVAQATPGKRPIFHSTGGGLTPTGKPSLHFDGADDCLVGPIWNLPQPTTRFVAVAPDANLGRDQHFLSSTSVDPLFRQDMNFNATIGTVALYAGAGPANSGAAPNPFAAWHSLSGSANGNNSQVGIDGGLTVGGAGNGAWEAPVVGGFTATPNNPISGSIAAVLVYNRALSTPERQQVEAYLRARFGTP